MNAIPIALRRWTSSLCDRRLGNRISPPIAGRGGEDVQQRGVMTSTPNETSLGVIRWTRGWSEVRRIA